MNEYSGLPPQQFVVGLAQNFSCCVCQTKFVTQLTMPLAGPLHGGVDAARHEIGFCWNLLFHALFVISIGPGSWHSCWREVLSNCKRLRIAGFGDDQLRLLSNLYPRFQSATMDAVQLSPLDFSVEFNCGHNCAETISDGVVISTVLTNMHLVSTVAPDRSAPRVAGSKFADRVMLAKPETRELLRQYSNGSRTSGLQRTELDRLISLLQDSTLPRERALAPVLVLSQHELGPNVRPFAWARVLLHELGAACSVCIMLRPGVFPQVQAWLTAGHIDLTTLLGVQQQCPCLRDFLEHISRLAAESPAHTDCLRLLATLLEVRLTAGTVGVPSVVSFVCSLPC